MPDRKHVVTTVENPHEHPAFLAWRMAGLTDTEPVRVESLKESRKTLACRLVGCGPGGSNVIAKRRLTAATHVEESIYSQFLTQFSGPSLRLLGTLDLAEDDKTWLFIEDAGESMPDFARQDHRTLLATWLGRLHSELSDHPMRHSLPERAVDDALGTLRRSRDGLLAGIWNSQVDASGWHLMRRLALRLDALESAWPAIEAEVAVLPTTIVHGDLVRKNLRVLASEDGEQIVPFDWETSGWGAPLADLASVDIEAYRSASHGFWGLHRIELERLAAIGHMFRLLAAVSWEIPALSTPWVWRPMYRLGLYDQRLERATERLGLGLKPIPRAPVAVSATPSSGTSSDPAHLAWESIWPERGHVSGFEELKGGRRKSRVVRLHGVGHDDQAVIAKECAADTGEIERVVHEEVLPRLGVPALRFYGYATSQTGLNSWLFLEDAGDRRFSPGDATHRKAAARWLATAHVAAAQLGDRPMLPRRDTDYYLGVVRSARHTLLAHLDKPAIAAVRGQVILDDIIRSTREIENRWSEIERACSVLPATIVHGGFGKKNVRVVNSKASSCEIRVFDWEFSGWGSPAADLAVADPRTYLDIAHGTWPQLDIESLMALREVGWLLRVVSAIPGESRSLDSDWPGRVISKMSFYRQKLLDAMKALALEPSG